MSPLFDEPAEVTSTPRDPGAGQGLRFIAAQLQVLTDVVAEVDRSAAPEFEAGIRSRLLADEPLRTGLAGALAQIIELATDINARIIGLIHSPYPASARDSFHQLTGAGILAPELSTTLAQSVGLREVLTYDAGMEDSEQVAAALFTVIVGYQGYVQAIGAWLQRQPGPQ